LLLGDPTLLSFGSIFIPLGCFLDDISRADDAGITAMTAYSAAAAIASFANTMALRAANTPDRDKYYLYVSEEHTFLATCLSLAAVTIPPLADRLIERSRTASVLRNVLPKVRGEVDDHQVVRSGTVIGLLAVLIHWRFPIGSLGTLSAVVFLIPLFVAFVLARAGTERHVKSALGGALLVAIAEATRALLFGFLRGDVAAPFLAFVVGALAGARSFKPLRQRIFLPVYGAVALFTIYFGAFGAMRGRAGSGLDRLQAIQDYHEQLQTGSDVPDQSVLSRLTTINQLSQIGRIVDEEGFLHGKTMDYLWYAFIPRFLWSEKPAIAKGAWFALRIGQARVLPDGRISNSINMTIPGELYLNYGWTGVFLGMTFLGAFLSLFWHTTNFWSRPRNVLGTAFGFYLIWPWAGFNLGADLQIFVTLTAVYLILVGAGIGLSSLRRTATTVRNASISARSA
jgi:hypothetical protein